MRIYVAHRRSPDYKKSLYEPLREAFGEAHELILPLDTTDEQFSAKTAIPRCDLVIAEVSQPSTGVGIELGWADSEHIRIVAIHRKDDTPSDAVQKVAHSIIAYKDSEDLISQLQEALK